MGTVTILDFVIICVCINAAGLNVASLNVTGLNSAFIAKNNFLANDDIMSLPCALPLLPFQIRLLNMLLLSKLFLLAICLKLNLLQNCGLTSKIQALLLPGHSSLKLTGRNFVIIFLDSDLLMLLKLEKNFLMFNTAIADNTFNNCRNIKFINIAHTVNYTGNNCFEHCSDLRTIIIPDDVITTGEKSFSSNAALIPATNKSVVYSILLIFRRYQFIKIK